MNGTKRGVLPLIAVLLVLAGSHKNTAQVVIPPSASLDLQIPAAPMPVAVGGRMHLAYELHITNFRTIDLALTRIDVLGGENSVPLASYRGAELAGGLTRVGARPDQSDRRVVGGGQRVVFFVWLALDRAVPSGLRHRVSFDVVGPTGAEAGTVEGGQITVRRDGPVVLDAPLRNGPWIAVYDPSMAGGHRRALFAIDGKARIPARFAIDWIKLGADGNTSRGDASVLSNWAGYGEDVLAVGDGMVADMVDRFPEPTKPITLDNSAGNYVTLDLSGGRFVTYEHLKPGSVRVKTGDRVRSGQVLALLGGSGSVSSGPHLHFHVSDVNSSLGAEGVPFVFRQFERLGAYESLQAFASGKPWVARPSDQESAVRMEMPRQQTVLRF